MTWTSLCVVTSFTHFSRHVSSQRLFRILVLLNWPDLMVLILNAEASDPVQCVSVYNPRITWHHHHHHTPKRRHTCSVSDGLFHRARLKPPGSATLRTLLWWRPPSWILIRMRWRRLVTIQWLRPSSRILLDEMKRCLVSCQWRRSGFWISIR